MASDEQERRLDGDTAGADAAESEAEVVEVELVPELDADGAEQAEGAAADPLVAVTRERDEYLQLAQRARADFENFRKRSAREVEEAERRGRLGLARDLLPAVDNLERGLRAAGIEPGDDERGSEDSPLGDLEHGVLLTYRGLWGSLSKAGVEAYDPLGEQFDPVWHEALSTVPAEGVAAGTVIETYERGYRLGETVLRPARVVVSA